MFNLKTKKLSFVILTLLVLAACNNNGSIAPSSSSTSVSSSSSELPSEDQYQIFLIAQQSGYTGTYQEWLDSIKGADGSSLLSGTTNPESTLGKNGDTYINTSTWDVYVKSGGNWTKVGNILGTKGADGLTPYIGTNGNWWIGDTDTGVSASGTTSDLENSQTFTVTFDSNGGTPVPSQQVKRLDKVTKPTDPTKNGFLFTGWFIGDEKWVFSGYNVTEDITLTAQYQMVENGTDGLLFSPTIYEGKQGYVVSGYEGKSGSITIPSNFNSLNVIGIQQWAFCFNCLSGGGGERTLIESVIIPETVKYIGAGAFALNQLSTVSIPNSVISIGEAAFYGNKLTSISIPEEIEMITSGAFAYNLLESISLPNNLKKIGINTSISEGGVANIGPFENNKLTSLLIPNSVIEIGLRAFAFNQLTSVTIPNSVTTIGREAFGLNQLTSVTIPNSVTTIGNSAFSSYNNQAFTIYVEAAVIPEGWNQNWFYSQNGSVTVVWDYKNQN